MSEKRPHIYMWPTLALVVILGLTFPLLAREAELESVCHNCEWDSGMMKPPVIIETMRSVKEVEDAPEIKPVKTYGNGTCVPYARARTGIMLYGWAGRFLKEAKENGYTVTEVPQIGCIVVTNEGGGHVAVVEEIRDDGILISEQNYLGLYRVSTRVIQPDDPLVLGYIY